MLSDLTSNLRQANIDLLFAQVRGSVRQRMRVTGLFDHIGEDHVFPSVDAVVQSFLIRSTAAAHQPPRLRSTPYDLGSPDGRIDPGKDAVDADRTIVWSRAGDEPHEAPSRIDNSAARSSVFSRASNESLSGIGQPRRPIPLDQSGRCT
jgi:hypothetical protein